MTEIQVKSILVRVSEGSNYRESAVCTVQYDATTFLPTSFFIFQVMEVYGPGDGVRFHQFYFLLPFRSQIKGMRC